MKSKTILKYIDIDEYEKMEITKYRTFREVEAEYLRNHPEEIDDYITLLFDEYAEVGDIKI